MRGLTHFWNLKKYSCYSTCGPYSPEALFNGKRKLTKILVRRCAFLLANSKGEIHKQRKG
jgi:hypothetical protein